MTLNQRNAIKVSYNNALIKSRKQRINLQVEP